MNRLISAFLATAAILTAIGADAQQQHGSLADQKACYDQAQKYITDKQKAAMDGEFLHFETAHFDSEHKTCYVRYSDDVFEDHKMVERNDYVDDAFEATRFAFYNQDRDKDQNKWIVTCNVDGIDCKTRQDYLRLVLKRFGL